MRRTGLFLTMSVTSGLAAVSGALLAGEWFGTDVGLAAGAIVAGVVAVLATVGVLVRAPCVPRRRARAVVTGAMIGLACAVVIALLTAITVIIPLVSFLLVGAGAVIADVDAATNERRALDAPVV